ncbi:MAG: SDR family oxidoreductase, partial [Actinomycetota bacterium]
MSALVYGGRSPIALEICKQLAGAGHEVHLVTRVLDDTITKLAKENDCVEVHECDLEDSVKSIDLAVKIDSQTGGLDAVAFAHRYRSEVPAPLKQYAVEVYTPFEILEALAARARDNECTVLLVTSPGAHLVLADQNFQYHASKAALSQLVRFGSVRF